MFFEDLNSTSKVWTYTSDRILTNEEVEQIQSNANAFVKDWAAHGAGLEARALVYKNRFVILAVDESNVNASGCSIDSSVKFIKSAGNHFKIDFFKRTNMIVESESGELSDVHVSDLKNVHNAFVYNPMITTLSQLRNEWLIPIAQSPFV